MCPELRATYRIQLHAGFSLDDAAGIIAYLKNLGVSHLYCSPYLQAAPGSKHGYDVVNHHKVNEELGGSEALARLHAELMQLGLGQVLDIVPNHMAIGESSNPWWNDVLENGPSSPYASYFDVDWNPPEVRHSNVVLTPVLGDHYGRVLEGGELQLEFDGSRFFIRYFDNRFPVDPGTLCSLLFKASEMAHSEELAFLADSLDRLPSPPASDRRLARQRSRDIQILRGLLSRLVKENPAVETAIQLVVEETNADFDSLDALLEGQNYRLSFWRMAQRELGYRRFFDINTLIGLRMEDEQVYSDTHALVLSWLEAGLLDGLRIDHPDGLLDPQAYFERLAQEKPGTWIGIEKILEPGERLTESWPVSGTTGYDFLNRVNSLFVDPSAEEALTTFYSRLTGCETDWKILLYEKKRLAASQVLGSDLNHLTALLLGITERHRRYRDYTGAELSAAISELAVCLPVYRTYVRASEGQVREEDIQYIEQAAENAKANRIDLDTTLFDFLRDLLLLRLRGEQESKFVMRFQQFTGPCMAKGVEDTAFYNYNRFISLNEVGGDPGHFGGPAAEFHRACQETQQRWPRSMLASSTHDTKRSEDVRARLNVLSEIPYEWVAAVDRWAKHNRPHRQGEWPDRNMEFLFYQTLVGAWPLDEERALQYMEKACREAKTNTSWTNPDPVYESAVSGFVHGIMNDSEFLSDLEKFVQKLIRPGRINSLAQTLLKLTTPGFPDLYQGTELWDLSLVDPDNRRPVYYSLRQELLRRLHDDTPPEEVMAGDDSGIPKLWTIRQALALRARRPELFGPDGKYTPLRVRGDHALAFTRGDEVAVIVPRLSLRAGRDWGETSIELPTGLWRNLLTHEIVQGGEITLAHLLARFPVCLLLIERY